MNLDSKKALAIIPARGGSKRLPGKNMAQLGGKPLIVHTLEAAIKSECFRKIIFSSDDPALLEIAGNFDSIDPEERPSRLAGDKVKVLELVNEIAVRPGLSSKFDVICLMLPTAPFRRASDIKAGFEMLAPEVDGVVSLTSYEFPPQLSVTIDDQTGLLKPVFDPSPLITGETRSQDQAPIYRPNGGFYVAWLNAFLKNRNFFKGRVRGYVMSRLASVDIDDKVDLMQAQFLLDSKSFVLEEK